MESSTGFPLSFFLAGLGYLVVTAAESSVAKLSPQREEDGDALLINASVSEKDDASAQRSPFSPGLLFLAALSFHSFFEGLAIGVEPNVDAGFPVLIAILAHKGFAAFALANALAKAQFIVSSTSAFTYMGCFSLVTPIGIAVGLGLSEGIDPGSWVGGITAFCAGTFLYVGLVEMIHRDVHANSSMAMWKKLFALAMGYGGMSTLATWT